MERFRRAESHRESRLRLQCVGERKREASAELERSGSFRRVRACEFRGSDVMVG